MKIELIFCNEKLKNPVRLTLFWTQTKYQINHTSYIHDDISNNNVRPAPIDGAHGLLSRSTNSPVHETAFIVQNFVATKINSAFSLG